MSDLRVKFAFGDDLRRRQLNGVTNTNQVTLSVLAREVADAFGEQVLQTHCLRYTDEDDDMITLGSEEELKEALKVLGNKLKFTVVKVSQGTKSLSQLVKLAPKAKVQAPKVQAPKVEEPKVEAPKVEAPKVPNPCDLFGDLVKGNLDFGSAMKAYGQFVNLGNELGDSASSELQGVMKELADVAKEAEKVMKETGIPQQIEKDVNVFLNGSPEQLQESLSPLVDFFRTLGVDVVSATVNDADSNDVVHRAICDVCNQTIRGIRYKCSVCPDYDLCQSCEAKNVDGKLHDASHLFVKLNKPSDRFAFARANQKTPQRARNPSWRAKPNTNADKPNPEPTPVPQVKLAARFVKDVTIPDGTPFAPNTKVFKIWRLRNSGTTAWPVGSRLVHVGADALHSELPAPLSEPVPVNGEVDIAVGITTPAEAGRYSSFWRMSFGDQRFGHRVWLDVLVEDESTQEVEPVVEEPVVEEPVVEVEPIVEEPEFVTELRQLADMGFNDVEANRVLLALHNGKVMTVVHELLNQ